MHKNETAEGAEEAPPRSSAYTAVNLLPPDGNTEGAAMNDNMLRLKTGLAEMLKGGVIMDVTNAEQARISQDGAWP
jgi:hypothetical protein